MSECAPCGLKIALCELTCVVKLFIVAEEEGSKGVCKGQIQVVLKTNNKNLMIQQFI